jgi:thioredoxin-like negative regulator of GroEL
MKAFLVSLGFIVFVGALIFGARYIDTRDAPVAPPASPATTTNRESAPHGKRPASIADKPALPPLFVQKSDTNTASIALAGPRAKPMLLHLWASWCGPCVQELPSILELGRKGTYDVMAVSVDDRWPDVVRFFGGTDKIPSEIAWDPKVTLEPTLGVGSLPTTFLVDTQGRVVSRFNGAHDWSDPQLVAALARAQQ